MDGARAPSKPVTGHFPGGVIQGCPILKMGAAGDIFPGAVGTEV